jgi:hypothetical protein
METLEVIAYLTVALVVGALLILFLRSIDYTAIYDKIKGSDSGDPKFEKVNKEQFVVSTLDFWESCGLGEVNRSLVLYVDDRGSLNKSYIFSQVKKINYCNTLQSVNEDCGRKEYVVFNTSVPLPALVNLKCNSISGQLEIHG